MERHASAALGSVPAGCFGVALGPVLGGARRVRAFALTNDDKVRVVGDEVRVDLACFERIARTATSDEQAGVDAALYVLHELAHLPQGIGDYATVRSLRTIGEDDLLTLDLGADHFAALVLAGIGDSGLVALKDRQGRSLCGYPVGPRHSPAARLRKARRVVSLRAEYLLRRAGVIPEGAGFLAAAFAPASGMLTLIEHGRGIPRVLGPWVLGQEAVRVLAAAADHTDDNDAAIAHLDAVLEGALLPLRAAA